MSHVVQVWNPTPYDRTEYLLYGTPHRTGNSIWNAGLGYINVAEVTVTANHYGDITIEELPTSSFAEQFSFHDQVISIFGLGLYPYIKYTDYFKVEHKSYFTLQAEDDQQGPVAFNNAAEVMHPKVIVQRWAARAGNIVAELTWTFFKNSRKSKMALRTISENKKNYVDMVKDVTFGFDGDGRHHIDNWFWFRDKTNLIPGDWIADSQGTKVIGECWFLSGGYTATEVETYNASKLWPLYGLYDWTTTGWGLFNVTPSALSSTLSATLWNQRKSQYNWFDPYEHKGRLLNYRPADTGAQDEFGAWTHLETVGCHNVKNALFDQLTVAQETLRDGNYFEPGTFKFVKTDQRPGFILWDNGAGATVRVQNSGFGYDVLGRTYTSNGGTYSLPYDGTTLDRTYQNNILKWRGHDAGHYGGIKSLAADFLLYGDFSSYYQLKQKVTQLKGLLPTSSTVDIHRHTYAPGSWGATQHEPREVGRPMFEAVYAYKVLGDEDILDRLCRRINEDYYWKWVGRSYEYWNGVGWYASDDGHFDGEKPFWFAWQDALFFQGLFALYEILKVHANLATNTTYQTCYNYIDDFIQKAGKAFVVYGCRRNDEATYPNVPAKAIVWWDTTQPVMVYADDSRVDSPMKSYMVSSGYTKVNQAPMYPVPLSAQTVLTELPPWGPFGTSAYDSDSIDDTSQFLWASGTDYGSWSMGLFSMVATYHDDVDVRARAYQLYNYWRDQSIISGGSLIAETTMNYAGYPQPEDPTP